MIDVVRQITKLELRAVITLAHTDPEIGITIMSLSELRLHPSILTTELGYFSWMVMGRSLSKLL